MARQPVTFCLQQQKVTKKCRNLTTKLEHDGCISQCFLSSSSREIIAKRYRGYFFSMLHLYQTLCLSLPFSEIIALLVISLCLARILSASDLHYTQRSFWVKNYYFELPLFIFFFSSTFFFERHAELSSKNRPLGTVFTCSKIKRSLLNLFVVASLCFEKSAVSEWYWLDASSDIDEQLKSSEKRFRRRC